MLLNENPSTNRSKLDLEKLPGNDFGPSGPHQWAPLPRIKILIWSPLGTKTAIGTLSGPFQNAQDGPKGSPRGANKAPKGVPKRPKTSPKEWSKPC